MLQHLYSTIIQIGTVQYKLILKTKLKKYINIIIAYKSPVSRSLHVDLQITECNLIEIIQKLNKLFTIFLRMFKLSCISPLHLQLVESQTVGGVYALMWVQDRRRIVEYLHIQFKTLCSLYLHKWDSYDVAIQHPNVYRISV